MVMMMMMILIVIIIPSADQTHLLFLSSNGPARYGSVGSGGVF